MSIRDELMTLYRDGFSEDSEEFVRYFFDHVYDEDNVFYRRENGKMISCAHVVYKRIKLYEKVTDIPYLVAVSTLTSYRGHNKIATVMRDAMTTLKDKHMPFVMLYPFKHDYYRKYGFKTVASKFGNTAFLSGYNRIKSNDVDIYYDIYRRYLERHDMAIYRDLEAMCAKLSAFYIDSDESYLIANNGENIGYILGNNDECDELVLVDDNGYARTHEGNMARLLDVKTALEMLNYDESLESQFVMDVIDDFMGDMSYVITLRNGKISVDSLTHCMDNLPHIRVTIGDLTARYFGYRDVAGLEFLPMPKGVDFTDMY